MGPVNHGLSAMSVFGETVGVRLLVLCSVFGVLTMVLIVATFMVKLATNLSIPAWATYVTGLPRSAFFLGRAVPNLRFFVALPVGPIQLRAHPRLRNLHK